jgi:UDP-glucose 4-epimerase
VHLMITGGAGFIGSVVAECALEAGHAVTVLDSLVDGSRGAVQKGCRFVHCDIGSRDALDAAFGEHPVDAVVHMAAEATIATSMTDPARYFDQNVVRALTLLDVMSRHSVSRIVFSSTAATYGEPRAVPIDESHPLSPINAYGESKLMFERCLHWYHRAYGFKVVALRFFNAAGATADHGEARQCETHLIPLVFSAALGQRPAINVFGTDYPTPDGTCVRDYVHVVDIAGAHLAALADIDTIGFDVFNVSGESGHSVLEVIDAVESVIGRPVPRAFMPRRPGDPAVLVASSEKLRRRLGWQARHSSLHTIIDSAWRWRMRFPSGYAD